MFFVGLIAGIATASVIGYKYIENKCRSMVLGMMDLNDDGKQDAVMLDTCGNGEIDTIIMDVDLD